MVRPPEVGDVLLVALPTRLPPGREQEGRRPAIVIGLPERLGRPRYPTLVAVPLTTRFGSWSDRSPRLYPALVVGTGGLPHRSIALLDQVVSVDASRVVRRLGRLTPGQYAPIREGLQIMMGSGSDTTGPV